MSKKWMLLVLAFLFPLAAVPVELVRDGAPLLPIVVPSDAIPAEKTAAKELAEALEKISGARFSVVGSAEPGAAAIYLGQSSKIAALLPDIDFSSLNPDELIVRAVGNSLVLTGGRPRGTLYAVYDFLEHDLGVCFWSSSVTEYPSKRSIETIASRRDAPVFQVRDIDYWINVREKRFTARMRYNGDFGWCNILPDEYGGSVCILGWCHTFHRLIPASKYYKSHPEWFAENNGKRVAHESAAQLCMTNPALQRELARNMAEMLRANPKKKIISLSINDGGPICQCASCSRIDKAEGSGAGSVLTGVNAVASILEKEFPDVRIETIAYAGMTAAPKKLKAHPNVIVRVCSMLANQAKKLDSPENASFRNALRNWKNHANQLLVWNYTSNFLAPFMPHPNLGQIAPDLRFFAENSVIGVFQEVEPTWEAPDLVDLRIWLYAKLLWNPYQDEQALTEKFLTGYYREAAPAVREYLRRREELVRDLGSLSMYQTSSSWIPFRTLLDWESLLKQAKSRTADPGLRQRLDRLILPLSMTIVQRPELSRISGGKAAEILRGKLSYDARCRELTAWLRGKNMYYPSRWGTVNATMAFLDGSSDKRWLTRVAPAPDFCRGKEYLELSAANGNFYQAAICKMVDDPAAAGGKAVEMTKVSVPWTLQVTVPPGTKEAKYQIYISAAFRFGSDKYPPKRPVMSGSYYIPAGKQIFPFLHIPAKEFSSSGYHWIKFGKPTQFSGGGYLYMNPHQIKDDSTLRIDRIILVRQ